MRAGGARGTRLQGARPEVAAVRGDTVVGELEAHAFRWYLGSAASTGSDIGHGQIRRPRGVLRDADAAG